MGALAAGVPQVVVPLFAFDQVDRSIVRVTAPAGGTSTRG
jgi:hypothetical protein